MIRDTDPARFVTRIQQAIDAGLVVVATSSRIEWLKWRYVRVYICKLEVPKSKLLLTWGPVSEQSPPDLQE